MTEPLFDRQLIYNLPEEHLASKGVMPIEHSDFEGTERLSLVLGADIVSTFDVPDKITLGECKLVEEVPCSLSLSLSLCSTDAALDLQDHDWRGQNGQVLGLQERRGLHDHPKVHEHVLDLDFLLLADSRSPKEEQRRTC